ncbi:MAG: copper chaperone PCu(A)C [Pyrobaculum sp.]
MRWYLAVLLVVALALAYLAASKPYVKDASYAMTAPDVGMVFLTFVNPTPFTKCIVDVEILDPPGLRAELHETRVNGTIVAMLPVDRVCVGPFSSVRFTHLSYHIMLIGNATGVVRGVLHISDGEAVSFEAPRRAAEVHMH